MIKVHKPIMWENESSNLTPIIEGSLNCVQVHNDLVLVNDRIDNSDYTILEPMICERCGGTINSETLKCEHCGTHYRKVRK